MGPLPTGALVIRVGPKGRPFYEAKWRLGGRQRLRRIGPAWLEAVDDGWQPRRGRIPEDHFDEKRAIVRMSQLIAEDAERSQREADEERPRLVARETDAVFVQHFRGHAKLSTTERYMHAKARHEDVERLNRAFGAPATAETG